MVKIDLSKEEICFLKSFSFFDAQPIIKHHPEYDDHRYIVLSRIIRKFTIEDEDFNNFNEVEFVKKIMEENKILNYEEITY